jgi:hypothetical protein
VRSGGEDSACKACNPSIPFILSAVEGPPVGLRTSRGVCGRFVWDLEPSEFGFVSCCEIRISCLPAPRASWAAVVHVKISTAPGRRYWEGIPVTYTPHWPFRQDADSVPVLGPWNGGAGPRREIVERQLRLSCSSSAQFVLSACEGSKGGPRCTTRWSEVRVEGVWMKRFGVSVRLRTLMGSVEPAHLPRRSPVKRHGLTDVSR